MIMKGQKISDRYQIIKSIGEGGMANVYLAYDTILDRNVAIKLLRGDLANDEKFVRRFQREALSASSLAHPNIVEVYDVGEDSGQYYIVMEYIEGKHLKALLKKRGKLTISEVVDIMLQITDGLSVAHDSYIIHRDIKPQNIMILENGIVKITDFGIAMAMNATQLTQTNSVMGSVHYLPPEQANGKGSTLQSDIYSMGILMYELLTGKLPYRGDNAVEIALKHLKEPLPSIREELPSIPQSIENIILKATNKNVKNRYIDAREMHEDLRTCLDDSRINEEKYTFKYPNTDIDDTKMIKVPTKKVEPKKEVEEEPIAKQISGDDLKKDKKILIKLFSIFTGLVVIITTIVVLIPSMTNKSQIKVPDVTGMEVREAITTLQEAGFTVSDEQEEESSTEIDEGEVTRTMPSAGSKKKKGYEVRLYVSLGDTKITIEDYTDDNYLEVQGALKALGLQVYVEKQEVEDIEKYKGKEEVVIGQSVKEGEKLSVGDSITLYIPAITVTYPNFKDGTWDVEAIENFAEEYDLTVNIEYKETTEYEAGTIMSQSKPEGYTVDAGQSFKVVVASSTTSDNADGETICDELGNCE